MTIDKIYASIYLIIVVEIFSIILSFIYTGYVGKKHYYELQRKEKIGLWMIAFWPLWPFEIAYLILWAIYSSVTGILRSIKEFFSKPITHD